MREGRRVGRGLHDRLLLVRVVVGGGGGGGGGGQSWMDVRDG
jgi:hypothetical protein